MEKPFNPNEVITKLEREWRLPHLEPLVPVFEPPEKDGVHELGTIQKSHPAIDTLHTSDLSSFSDYKLLTLGPVYVIAKINFSINEQLSSEIGTRFKWITVDAGRSIFDNLNEWNSLIEGVHKQSWDIFLKNVLSIHFIDRKSRIYWEIVYQLIQYTPPGLSSPVELTTFLPTGNLSSYRVTCEVGSNRLHVMQFPPMQGVIDRGNTLLSM